MSESITDLGWNSALIYRLADGLDPESETCIVGLELQAAWYMHRAVDSAGDQISGEPVYRVGVFWMEHGGQINIEASKAECAAWWTSENLIHEFDMLGEGNSLPYEEEGSETPALTYFGFSWEVPAEHKAKALMIWAWAATPLGEGEKYLADTADYVPDTVDFLSPRVFVQTPYGETTTVGRVLEDIAEFAGVEHTTNLLTSAEVPYLVRPHATAGDGLDALLECIGGNRVIWTVYENETLSVLAGDSGRRHAIPVGYPGVSTQAGLKDGGAIDVVKVLYLSADLDSRFDDEGDLVGTQTAVYVPAPPTAGQRVGILDLTDRLAMLTEEAEDNGTAYLAFAARGEWVGTATLRAVPGAAAIRAGDLVDAGPVVGGLVTSTEIDVDSDTVTVAFGGYPLTFFGVREHGVRVDADTHRPSRPDATATPRRGGRR
jgi:hypothetical protein